MIGGDAVVDTVYGRPVSSGIRRCEFDHYLLQRSGADVRQGTPVTSIARNGSDLIVNDSIKIWIERSRSYWRRS